MNILRWKRKSKKKIRFKTIILFIFSLIMTTFAWFAYSKVLEPTLNIHMSSWDMEYYIGEKIPANKKTNPISVEIPVLYPSMNEETVTVDIFNKGETLVDIYYQIQSVTIGGITYEIVEEGRTNTTSNYIALAKPLLRTNSTTGEQIYKGIITNDFTKFPFTIEIEHSAEVQPVSEDAYGTITPGQGYMKITVNWIGDNNKLDSEWGYIVGQYLEANPTGNAMTIVLSIDSYQAEDPNRNSIIDPDILPTTAETKPFLPTGFTRVPGTNLNTGLVIQDEDENEYVWIEVPKSATVYQTAGMDITNFTEDEYNKIENDIRTNYLGDYSTREDVHTNYDAIGLSLSNYTTTKQKMLKSIYTNGGFYIGRYETGIESGFRTGASATLQTPVIKPRVYPFNYVTCAQANTLAIGMAPSGYTTSLMFGLQWDLVMKYLQTKGVTQDMLKTDSTSWGNYASNSYSLTNANTKYMPANTWLSTIPYEKDWDEELLITSGGNTSFCRQNIYDIAGNLSEWTYNVIYKDNYYLGGNGGDYLSEGNEATATNYGSYNSMTSLKEVGFRVTLY